MTAYEFGKQAYKNGINAPVQDKEFMKTLANGSVEKELKSWVKGWNDEYSKQTAFAI